jgi:replicative DNA helicase
MTNEEKLIPYVLQDHEIAHKINLNFIKNKRIKELLLTIKESNTNDLILLTTNTTYSLEELEKFYKTKVDIKQFDKILEEVYLEYFKSDLAYRLISSKSLKEFREILDEKYRENLSIDKKAEEDFSFKTLEEMILELEKHKKYTKLSFGLDKLDKLVTSPLEPEEITILVGQKGMGKSSVIKNLEINLVKQKIPVLSFNLEMSLRSNICRILSIFTGIPFLKILYKYTNEEENKILEEAKRELISLPYLYNGQEFLNSYSLFSLVEKGREILKKRGFKTDRVIVFVDSLDMLEGFTSPSFIKEQMEILHSLVRKHKVHLVGTVQANENKLRGGNFKNPEEFDNFSVTKYDIYGSSYYAARARLVLFINRPLVYKKEFFGQNLKFDIKEEEDLIYFNIVKQNDGDLGTAIYRFNSSNFRIEEYDEEDLVRKEEEIFEDLEKSFEQLYSSKN